MGWESALVYDLSGLFGGRAGRPGSPLWPPAIGREKLRIAGERANESILSEVGQQPPQAGCDTVTSWKRSNRRRQIAGSHLANFPAGFIRLSDLVLLNLNFAAAPNMSACTCPPRPVLTLSAHMN